MAVVCSNCSGRLIFNPASQKLECAACGSMFNPEDVRDIYADVHSKYYDTRVYTCSHCGAEVITSDSEVSTFCVYCGNPAIVFSRISKEYRPDGIIPFKVTKEDAIRFIKIKFRKHNPIVPKEARDRLTLENIRGIYVPYWVINAKFTETDYISGIVQHNKSKEKEYYIRSGDVNLRNVPIDGSKMLNDNISRKLEPFFLEDSKTFDEDYLNGFYSNTSDLTYPELKDSAALRCHYLFSEEVASSIRAKDVKIEDTIYWVDILDNPVYMMMPVWFFTFKYNDKPYTLLVNGQTGKVVGTMPWNKKKVTTIAIVSFVVSFILFAAFFLLAVFRFAGGIFGHAMIAMFAFAFFVFVRSIIGLKRIKKNLKLTQSEDIFRFVKKRQE